MKTTKSPFFCIKQHLAKNYFRRKGDGRGLRPKKHQSLHSIKAIAKTQAPPHAGGVSSETLTYQWWADLTSTATNSR